MVYTGENFIKNKIYKQMAIWKNFYFFSHLNTCTYMGVKTTHIDQSPVSRNYLKQLKN
jgi:hypothetical protein